MSNLREKARAVKAAGEAERGNFEPGGVPKRVYDFWLDNTNSKRGRAIRNGRRKENFCHFWRVVAVWAPLMWVRKTVTDHAGFLLGAFGVALAVAFFIALFTVPDFWQIVLMIIGMTLAFGLGIGGLIAGVSAALTPEERAHADTMRDTKTIAVFGILGLPTFIIGFVFMTLFRFLYPAVVVPLKNRPKLAGGLAAGIVLGFSYLISFSAGGFFGMLVLSGILVAAAALIALVIFIAVVVSDYVAGKRALAEQQRELYYETHGEFPAPPVKEPSAIERKLDAFFRGLGDFIVLIAQVVRVNKWKICPTVEIDTKA